MNILLRLLNQSSCPPSPRRNSLVLFVSNSTKVPLGEEGFREIDWMARNSFFNVAKFTKEFLPLIIRGRSRRG
jgi:hypothetical protein